MITLFITYSANYSYECFMEVNGTKMRGVQHCWTINELNKFVIEGTLDTSIYQ